MELNLDQHTDMDLAHTISSSSSTRSSTPIMTNCERLQIANSELRKFSILHANVLHAIEAAAPYAQNDDSDLADMYSKQGYLEQRRQQAVSDLATLPRCNTPGCRIHSTPVNSPTKTNVNDFPELPKKASSKRKESDDGFISPTSKQTFNNLIRPNLSYTQAASKKLTVNSKPPQQMATPTNTRRNPAMSSNKQTNQVVLPSPIITNTNVEDNSPQALILQTLQQTIQALTVITQQFSALTFNNPAPNLSLN
ncbi:hypothetical protein TNIN_260411 [Trichonephila inaurata madagascariensis]|uniref:Uncharacterized protein n=1 Tax=Trichonephila inaurata madagascariensis TaxID=2747483 RepID=A0A8X6K8S9_9ARAC|nr:hypothetical protein TNIN_260411 [Trichonephila inaurata madagascariensis]